MKTETFKCIDLFAGIGGFRIAAERCGGECIGYSEINSDAISTYESNYPSSRGTNFGDITKISDLPEHDLMTGGVPCQSWSIAGRNLGFDDDRGELWNDAIYLLNKSRPKAFIFENVKGLVDPRNQKALDYILNRIRNAGYFAQAHVLNAFDYGVPQSRVRVYIVGFREKKWMDSFRLPEIERGRLCLRDIIDDMNDSCASSRWMTQPVRLCAGATSLSKNNNGFNDYFLFNDLRNGNTTIHSWDIIKTSCKEKRICLLLLRNRRKDDYGVLDGNPLSIQQFQELDQTIVAGDIEGLCHKGILRPEIYRYRILRNDWSGLDDVEKLVLGFGRNGFLVPDEVSVNREIKTARIDLFSVCSALVSKRVLECVETRYDFKNTKISTGLFGVNRIFLPSSNIFPTLVASDTNDFITPVALEAVDAETYRKQFLDSVYKPKRFRKITQVEACRIQGFPDDFKLPIGRSRWMKLIGNSVAVHVVQRLVQSICDTGAFGEPFVKTQRCDKYEVRKDGQLQMLLAVERKKAKLTSTQKNKGMKGKNYSAKRKAKSR